jgi:acetyltransferase-like isoleucine patch superfamily enzyme
MSTVQQDIAITEASLVSMSRIATKLNSIWLRRTYPFAEFGRGVSVHYSCEIGRSQSPEIQLGDGVYLAPGVWLDVAPGSPGPGPESEAEPKIVIGNGCAIGRRCTMLARNQIVLEADVLLGPSVLIMDHNDEASTIENPVHAPRAVAGGRILIERNCWLGIGAVIACGAGDLTIGRNSVVGANAVVSQSFPPFSVIAGNPAKLVKTYDQRTGKWVRPQ